MILQNFLNIEKYLAFYEDSESSSLIYKASENKTYYNSVEIEKIDRKFVFASDASV